MRGDEAAKPERVDLRVVGAKHVRTKLQNARLRGGHRGRGCLVAARFAFFDHFLGQRGDAQATAQPQCAQILADTRQGFAARVERRGLRPGVCAR